jgi:FtsP/CotA-like multicopper oxidase with cupredoxin domain
MNAAKHLLILVVFVLSCAPADESTLDPSERTQRPDEPREQRVEVPTEPVEKITEPKPELLPLPSLIGVPLAEDINPSPTIVEVNLTAKVTDLTLLEGKTTTMWTYNGQLPGPTIQARVGDRLIVRFTNELPDATTVHWHGLRVPNEMDGAPLVQFPVQPGETFTYDFILKDAGTYWYHPHMMTHVQVERGLYGPLVVHEADPPVFDAERIVFLDDIRLEENGQRAGFHLTHPERMHGRHGNVLLMNGKVVDEEDTLAMRRGTVERWRILNSANARIARVDLGTAQWRVIASDGGLVPTPYSLEVLQIVPGERYDLEVRWDPENDSEVGELRYWVPVVENEQVTLAPIVIQSLFSSDQEPMPPHDVVLPEVILPDWPVEDEPTIVVELEGKPGVTGQVQWMLNGEVYGKHTPVKVDLDSHHTIDLVNTQDQVHPMHIHGHFFQIMSRDGVPTAEAGLKDTVLVGPQETVRLSILFDNPGQWMYHCHILEHAAMGMMGVIEVY